MIYQQVGCAEDLYLLLFGLFPVDLLSSVALLTLSKVSSVFCFLQLVGVHGAASCFPSRAGPFPRRAVVPLPIVTLRSHPRFKVMDNLEESEGSCLSKEVCL